MNRIPLGLCALVVAMTAPAPAATASERGECVTVVPPAVTHSDPPQVRPLYVTIDPNCVL